MFDNNMKSNNMRAHTPQPQEEFLRQVLFMKDEEKVLAVFPFYHNISDNEYEMVVGNFFTDVSVAPPKHEFCLMHETEFGWGWIHNKMITHLEVAEEQDYADFKNLLVSNKVIKETFILNEE
jgi:hypothetical protein